MLDQADKALKNKNYKDAQKLYRTCLEKGDDIALSYLGLSTSSYYLREYQSAQDYALKAIEICPDLSKAHLILAYIFARNRNLLEAEKEVNLAFALSSEDSEILSFGGGVLVALQKIKEGRMMLQKARGITPDDWTIYYNLGSAYLVEKKYRESLREYIRSFRLKKSFQTLGRILVISAYIYKVLTLTLLVVLALIPFYTRSIVLLLIPTMFIILVGLTAVLQRERKGFLIILFGLLPLLLFYLTNR